MSVLRRAGRARSGIRCRYGFSRRPSVRPGLLGLLPALDGDSPRLHHRHPISHYRPVGPSEIVTGGDLADRRDSDRGERDRRVWSRQAKSGTWAEIAPRAARSLTRVSARSSPARTCGPSPSALPRLARRPTSAASPASSQAHRPSCSSRASAPPQGRGLPGEGSLWVRIQVESPGFPLADRLPVQGWSSPSLHPSLSHAPDPLLSVTFNLIFFDCKPARDAPWITKVWF